MTTNLRGFLLAAVLCTPLFTSHAQAVGPTYNVPPNAAPAALLAGETMNLGVGGSVGINFIANAGSAINIQGGNLSFATVSGSVDLYSGQMGSAMSIQPGSVVTVHGGTVFPTVSNGGDFTVLGGTVFGGLNTGAGGKLTVKGGQVGPILASQGSQIFLRGGTISGALAPLSGTTFTMSGGTWQGNFWFAPGSTLNLSGGTVQNQLSLTDTILNLTVRSVLVGGSPIPGLVPGVAARRHAAQYDAQRSAARRYAVLIRHEHRLHAGRRFIPDLCDG